MEFLNTDVAGASLVEPTPHLDERGRFMRAWCQREFAEHRIDFVPVQSNLAFSKLKGTLRGLHYQVAPALEAKLVRCTRGAAFDLVLDLRRDSPTYLRWYGTHLSADNGRMLFVPEGCAHGAQSLEDDTEILYMASAYYAPSAARGVRHDDPAFGISWPIEVSSMSDQDRRWPLWNPT
ncbi:MAG: dTDP-4-dehydrorhamnose 3,5-epimerase [Caldimonas sp.]